MPIVPPALELHDRIKRLRAHLASKQWSGALISDPVNVRYLSGFTGDESALLITSKQRLILTDFRFIEEAKKTARGWRIVAKPGRLMQKAGDQARALKLRTLAVEDHNLSLLEAALLRKAAKGVKVRSCSGLVSHLRLLKSPWEMTQIRKALHIQQQSFLETVALFKPGLREYEAAAELRYRMVKAGADDQAFDTMIQWDASACMPHGRPSNRRLQENSLVLIDWGARFGGYHADLTRTFFLGSIPSRFREIHEVVMEAQKEAIGRVAPDVPFREVDRAARSVIRDAGYGEYFGHSTGHGLGLKIHEAPTLAGSSEGVLSPGMVVTVEPGIYLPGRGGVRIEDDVLVTERGGQVLSNLPKGLRFDGAGA